MRFRLLASFIIVFCLTGTTLDIKSQTAVAEGCDYYASPNGNGNGLSKATAFTLSDFLDLPEIEMRGKTLCMLDGTYYDSLTISKSGTASQPITIMALNDGKVTIDGEYQRQPAKIRGSYIVIEGMIFKNSSSHVVAVTGGHNIFRRVSAYNAEVTGNNHIWLEDGSSAQYNLYEDIVAAGTGRVCVEPFKGSVGAVYRRVYARMGQGPQGMYHTCYQPYSAVDSLCENCILEFEEGTSPSPGPAITNTDSPNVVPENNRVTSSIIRDFTGVADGQEDPNTPQLFTVENTVVIRDRYYGFTLRSGAHTVQLSNIVVVDSPIGVSSDNFRGNDQPTHANITNSVFLNDNTGIRTSDGTSQFVSYSNFYNNGTNFYGDITQGQGITFIDPDYDVDKYGDGAYLMPPQNLEGKGENGQNMGADIRYRSVNGVLTDEPLWPWPMEERIQNELGTSVTWESNGGIWKTLDGVYDDLPHLMTGISANPQTGVRPLSVDFTSSTSGGTQPYSFAWNFGDGNTSNEGNPSHTYTTTGNFIATLTVTDGTGEQASDSVTIQVTDPDQVLSISDIRFTSPGQSQALSRLQSDTWYDLYVHFNSPNGWGEIAFADLWLSAPSYTEGTIENRGGSHYAARNYVLSYSIAGEGIWAKETEGTETWSNITGLLGRYVDDDQQEYEQNSDEGWAKARVMLLSDAEAGTWKINAYVKEADGDLSQLYSEEIMVETWLAEDVNQDGSVNSIDVQLCVNVLTGQETDAVITQRADVNADEVVDPLDVQQIIQLVLGG